MAIFNRFSGGIHPPGNKGTRDSETVVLDGFKVVRIPMLLHNGPPSVCIVKKGDEVSVGQLIGKPEHPLAVSIHSSVSGKVRSVADEVASNGQLMTVVTIDCDGQQTVAPDIGPPTVESREDFINAVREAGLVGLGGAGFPTHIKLKPPADKYPDTLLLNGAECEPYITSDFRLMVENPDDVIEGIEKVLFYMEIPRALIGIEKNKPEAIRALKETIEQRRQKTADYPDIEVVGLPTRYPQGAEKMLIKVLTGRIVPFGGLPHDVHVMVMNVNTARSISDYLKTGMPLIRKTLTLDGDIVKKPGNYNVPVGLPIADLIQAVDGLDGEASKILMGGPMMGIAVDRTEASILKINNAILVFGKTAADIPDETDCIRCARCVEQCPMKLVPTTLDAMAREHDLEGLMAYDVNNCIECGCCSYVCPAKRYLVQSIRNGKAEIRAARAKEASKK